MKKSGFTLVELAIVLVIIGLLTGGVLVAQSMIDTAKVNAEVRKLTQWSIAMVQFRNKYNQEAGDSILFTPSGNNNGATGSGDASESIGACPNRVLEPEAAWAQLTTANMLGGEQYVWNGFDVCAGNYLGSTPLSVAAGTIGDKQPYAYFVTRSGYTYGGNFYNRRFRYQYLPLMLQAIESKLDDGVPSQSTGLIVSYTNNGFDCTQQGVQDEIDDSGSEQYGYCTGYVYFSPDLNIPITPR